MVENKSSLFGIITIIIGASGLGLGVDSITSVQVVEGLQGPPGNDAPRAIQVGILDPDSGKEVLGTITIRALIAGSENYIISILRNGTQIGTSLPYEWDTSTVSDGWWNITVKATDVLTNNVSSDEVIIFVKNMQEGFICSSEQEINDVLDKFGTGTVKITLINTIVLTSPIVLNEGGNYTIKGVNSLTVCGSDNAAFEITNVSSCNIYGLTIDASAITSDGTPIIHINEVNDIQVHIWGVLIFGDSDKKGCGIYIQSDNVLIRDCIFSFLNRGIHLSHSSYTYIHYSDFNNNHWGIYNYYGDYNIIGGNSIEYTNWGIYIVYGDYNIINNNELTIPWEGIVLDHGYKNTVTGNILNGNSISSGAYGILILGETESQYHTIFKNLICYWPYGVFLVDTNWIYIVNNTFITNGYHIMGSGTPMNTIVIGNYHYDGIWLF